MIFTRRKFLQATSAAGVTPVVASVAGCGQSDDTVKVADQSVAGVLPPIEERPRIRYWWPGGAIEPTQIEQEVNALADAGFGGFEIADVRDGITVPMNPAVYGWGGKRWVAGVEQALETAAKRGLKVDITLGAHWPTGMPGVTPDDKAAAKEIVHGAAIIAAGESFSGSVPQSDTQPSGLHMHTTPPVVTPELLAVRVYRVARTLNETKVLDPESMVDLTAEVDAGAIHWTAPSVGEWVLLAFWMRGTAQTQNMFDRVITTSMLTDPVACAVDVYGKAGTQVCIDYWETHLLPPRTRELLAKIGGNFFEDSLELKAIKHWSPDLPQEFMAYRGYDLMDYLPLLATNDGKEFVFGPGMPTESARPFLIEGVDENAFDEDFQHTLTQMYAHNRVQGLVAWAETLGMGLRAQCSGLAASYCSVPEGDNGDTIDSFLAKAAARDIGGHKILSDEAATFVGGQAHVADWKLLCFMLQRDFSGGVNQVVLHGTSYADAPGAEWPGFSAFGRFIGNDWGPRSPLWKHASDTTGYLARLQNILQGGMSQADVVVLDPTERSHVAFNPGRNGSVLGDLLRSAGYTRHHINADLLTHENVNVEDGIITPNGAAYRALVVQADDTIEPVTTQVLANFAQQNVRIIVVGKSPDTVPGLGAREQRSIEMRATWVDLMNSPSVTSVATEADVISELGRVGINPSLRFSRPSRVMPIIRRYGADRWAYLLNDSDAPLDITVSLAGEGVPVLLDAWTGDYREAEVYSTASEYRDVPLRFNANQAIIVGLISDPTKLGVKVGKHAVEGQQLVRKGAGLAIKAFSAGEYSVEMPNAQRVTHEVASVPAPTELSDWLLKVDSWMPGSAPSETRIEKHELRLSILKSWTEIDELKNVSGIGRYSCTANISADVISDGGVMLDLGHVAGSYRVFINGHNLPVCNQFEHEVDVSDFVVAGDNVIEVEVATTLNNAIRGLGKTPILGFLPPGVELPQAEFSSAWQPARDADPLLPPKGEYLGAPIAAPGPGGAPGMAPGAGTPGGQRAMLPSGLIGPVKLKPFVLMPV